MIYGVHIAIVAFYFLVIVSYIFQFKLFILNIMAFYCLYISFQLSLFCCNETKQGSISYPICISYPKFILFTWLFGWFNVGIFERYFILNGNKVRELQESCNYQQQMKKRNDHHFKAVAVHPMSNGFMF